MASCREGPTANITPHTCNEESCGLIGDTLVNDWARVRSAFSLVFHHVLISEQLILLHMQT